MAAQRDTDVANATWDRLLSTIGSSMAAKAMGEPYDSDALQDAVDAIAAAQLIAGGASEEWALRQVLERDHVARVRYNAADDTFDIEIEWDVVA